MGLLYLPQPCNRSLPQRGQEAGLPSGWQGFTHNHDLNADMALSSAWLGHGQEEGRGVRLLAASSRLATRAPAVARCG